MSESSGSTIERFKGRMKNTASFLRRGLPFASGVFATLVAILIYHYVLVLPNQLTTEDVNASWRIAMASATRRLRIRRRCIRSFSRRWC
jgi:hypothetical protein